MKKFFKYSFLLMAVGLTFVSCKEDDDYTAGKWNAEAGYANLYFPEIKNTVELDPTDPTEFDVKVVRRNVAGALTVNFDVIENDEDIFEVGPAVFAEGDSLAKVKVKFPKAEIGTAYNLQLSTSDPKFVSEYSDSILYSATVTRIKWNLLGTALLYERAWYEWQDKDGNDVPTECNLYQRDDMPSQFRLEDPFSVAKQLGYTDGNESEYITFRVYRKADVEAKAGTDDEYTFWDTKLADMIGDDDFVYFNPINTGYFNSTYGSDVFMYHPAHFSSMTDWTYNKVVSYQKEESDYEGHFEDSKKNTYTYRASDGAYINDNDGSVYDGSDGALKQIKQILPGKVQLAPYCYMPGIGGWNYTTNDGMVELFFPGYTEPHVADITSDDFTWEEVMTGSFTSEKQGTSEATLYKGTCVNKEDGCDTIFAQTYGTAYKIGEPYAEGYDLYFAVDKNGKIVIPDGSRLQPTGLDDNMGHDIYAKIDQTTSSFSATEVILTVGFFNEDETIDYGESTEVLANISWTKIATGTYYYVMFAENEEGNPEPDPGYELYKRDDRDDTYKIADWLMGTDFMFQWDRKTNACEIALQSIGYTDPQYGPMSIIEGALYSDRYAVNKSYYDPEKKMFHFFPAYFVADGSYGQVEEFFEITETAGVKRHTPVWGNAQLNTAIRMASRWNGTKTNKAMRLAKKSVLCKDVLAR